MLCLLLYEENKMVSKSNLSAIVNGIDLSERSVFEMIFQSFYHPLCFYAEKYVGGEAEDIIENLFVKLWDKQKVFEGPVHLRAFLYRATRNACLNHLKANARHYVSVEEIGEHAALTEKDHLNVIIQAEIMAEIYRAVHQLPAQCSKVIAMSFLENLSNAEIATELNLSEQTVKNLKVIGLRLLKSKLSGRAFSLLILQFWIH